MVANSFAVYYRFQALTEDFDRGLKKMSTKVDMMTQKLRAMQSSANSMANTALSNATKLTVAIGAMSVPIFKFETELNRMVAASGKTHDAMKPLIELTQKLGATTEHSASQAMQGATKLVQAGFSQNQVLQLLPQTLQLATAGYMDMASSSAMLSDAVKSFGLEAKDSQRIVDVLAKGATLAKLDVKDFGDVLGKVGGMARVQNQSFERTMAMFMAIKDTGLEASIAATGLGSLMGRMSKPTKEATQAFEELGIDIEGMIAKGAKFDDIMSVLATKQINTAQGSAIFGIEQQKVGWALVQNYQKINKYTAELENANGSAKKMQDTMNTGLIGASNMFKSALEGLILKTGEEGLTGAITHFLQVGTKMINKINEMDINWQKVISTVFKVIAGLLAFYTVMKTIAIAVTIVQGFTMAFSALSVAFGVVSGAVTAFNAALNILSFGNPITAFVAIVVGAIILIYKYWDSITAFFVDKWEWVTSKIQAVKDFFNFGDDEKEITKNINIQKANAVQEATANQKIDVNNSIQASGNFTLTTPDADYNAQLESLKLGVQ